MIETIPPALAGQRVDRVVAMLVGCPRSVASALVDAGAVKIDSSVVSQRSARVEQGNRIEIEEPKEVDRTPQPDPSVPLTVLYEDEHVVVIDKPAGIVVHPGAGNGDGTLVNGLLARYPEIASVGSPDRPGIVHRLDKDTSGLIMVARSPKAYESLVGQLSSRTARRTYQALVKGQFETAQGVIDAAIGRSKRDPTRMTVSASGRDARTQYVVEQTWAAEDVSYVVCRLETGRTHQIRVHLSAIGHPIVGDRRYGVKAASRGLSRPWLHAARLGFVHPVSEEDLEFHSTAPSELTQVLDELGTSDD